MEKKQHIAIFTTASLPWLTGTAVNPLFRAAYLAKDEGRKVTLVIPWLSFKDQKHVYPDNRSYDSPAEQEKYVRQWLEERIGFTSPLNIRFYPGKVIMPYFLNFKPTMRMLACYYYTRYSLASMSSMFFRWNNWVWLWVSRLIFSIGLFFFGNIIISGYTWFWCICM